jgi:TIR domain
MLGQQRAAHREDRIVTDASAESAGRIFICYRRGDAGYPAGWLFDELVERYGAGRVFKDVDSIEPGDDFTEVINEAVGSCLVLLAVIGRAWLDAAGEDGPRLDDPDDFVRLEIEAALARDVRVIPVLVDGARMPKREHLPPSLGKLATRHAVELRPAQFRADLRPLLKVLDKTLGGQTTPPGSRQSHARAAAPPGEGLQLEAHRDHPDATLATVLARLETYGSPHVRHAYSGLAEIGYVMRPSVPRDPARPPQSYLRIHDPNRPGPAVGYLTPHNISFTLDRALLNAEPGGHVVPSTGEIAFPHADPDGLARGLQVAARLKRN